MLAVTSGMIDRRVEDIMLETAIAKVFASEIGFRTVDEALQIMGGEGYMTENVLERIWRDSRIYIIVEGANEVMESFIFGYGAEHFGESLRAIKEHPFKKPLEALKVAGEIFLGIKRRRPRVTGIHDLLSAETRRFEELVQTFSHAVVKSFYRFGEGILTRQMVHSRVSRAAMWLYAMACSLAKADDSVRRAGRLPDDERAVLDHLLEYASGEVTFAIESLKRNPDATMRAAAAAARRRADALPNGEFAIPEKTPDESARGTGRKPNVDVVPQF